MLSFLSSGLPGVDAQATGAGVHWQVDTGTMASPCAPCALFLVRPGDCRTHARDEPCERPQPLAAERPCHTRGPRSLRDTERGGCGGSPTAVRRDARRRHRLRKRMARAW